jgi:cytochrome c553
VLGISGVAAAGDVATGRAKSSSCATCHGKDGIGTMPLYPNLAGQNASYLAKALQEFRDGTRSNEMMNIVAQPLSDQDIEDLATFYESLPCGARE